MSAVSYDPEYLAIQRFLRVEAIGMRGARHADPEDPVRLEVRVTPTTDLDLILDSVIAMPSTRDRLRPLRVGVWGFQLDPAVLEADKAYVIHWRFYMTPENLNVSRQTVVYKPINLNPYNPDAAVVYGRLQDATGIPIPCERFVIETYRDTTTLTRRESSVDVVSDCFGNWSQELPRGSTPRFVFGNYSRVVQIPEDVSRIHYEELEPFQPAAQGRVDKYGYPVP